MIVREAFKILERDLMNYNVKKEEINEAFMMLVIAARDGDKDAQGFIELMENIAIENKEKCLSAVNTKTTV